MPRQSAYDAIAEQYVNNVNRDIIDQSSVMSIATNALLRACGDIENLDICDLACGEGHLSRQLAKHARSVTGIDISQNLLSSAIQQDSPNQVDFVLDDAQRLTSQPDAVFDLVVSNLALMDIPDLQAVYGSVYRILRAGGHFVFSITHPCFQSPHASVDSDESGGFTARRITRYASEGHWQSDYAGGIRGQVGANHRMLSTYINALISTGFRLDELTEPTLPPGQYPNPFLQAQVEIPSVLVIKACKPLP